MEKQKSNLAFRPLCPINGELANWQPTSGNCLRYYVKGLPVADLNLNGISRTGR
jgi:hypothetical protein